MLNTYLSDALQIPADTNEEETSAAIVALLTSAVHDDKPRLSLEQIYHAISISGSASLLDPLNTLQLLVPCRDEAAKRIMTLISENCSAKEVVITVQEAVERLETALSSESDDDDDEPSPMLTHLELSSNAHNLAQTPPLESYITGGQTDDHLASDIKSVAKKLSPPGQLINLVDLYSGSIPRLRLRKKTASGTLRPLISELESTIQYAGGQSSRSEGRELIKSVSQLVQNVIGWVSANADVNDGEVSTCNDILKSLVDATIICCSRCIHSSLAQRTFEAYFPQFTIRSTVEPGWEDGEKVVSDAINAYTALGISPRCFSSSPSTASLILLAHSPDNLLAADHLLSAMLPILLASIQANAALDESLSLLLRTLDRARTKPNNELSPDVIIPLSTVLSSLASAHPEPAIRHTTFRVLSLLLSLSPSHLRLQLLKDLTSDSEFPQMRAAAIGLVKEAVLEGISPTTPKPNIFASPLFLQVLGPVLLRSNPPDLFSTDLSVEDFQKSPESSRLVECLALYYILLLRDKDNRTGILALDTITNVEKSFLRPLRSCLARWMNDLDISGGSIHEIMPLVSLKISLERVDGAIAELGPKPGGP